jgi:MPBQ/MSBQ methyltransferase
MLDFLYSEWSHPYFISIEDYSKLMLGTDLLEDVGTDDWTPQTIASWRHSIWVGVYNPWPVIKR